MATVNISDVQEAQVHRELDKTIKSFDPIRADSLQKLQRVKTAKIKSQEREKSRLAEKLGGEHPRVMALQEKIDTNYEVARNLNMESIRARTKVPSVKSDDWLVHGRVLNDQLEAVPGMKAALYDRSGCPVETCGSEFTDKTGYFNLIIKNVARTTGTTAPGKKKVVDEARAAGTTDKWTFGTGLEDDGAGKSMDGFLFILDRKDVIVHRDKRPLAIAPGQAQYLEIVLDDQVADSPTQPKTRYLGNSGSRVLHDLKNQKRACQIDEIGADQRVNFKTQKEALARKYSHCPYCFGRSKSKA